MKKIITIAISICFILFLCACGIKASIAAEESHKDSDIASSSAAAPEDTESSIYPQGSCGAIAEDGEVHKVPVSIENDLGEDINGFYICPTGETVWDNMFDEDEYLGKGKIIPEYITINYSTDSLSWDLGIRDESNEIHEFNPVDISNLDAEGFTVTFTKSSDGSYCWKVDKSFVKR